MHLPLLGGGWEGVFRASFAKTLAIYPSMITQMLLDPPPYRRSWVGVFRASFAKTLAIYTATITQMLLAPPPSRGRLGGGISRQHRENVGTFYISESENTPP